jgi:hypothetical protein
LYSLLEHFCFSCVNLSEFGFLELSMVTRYKKNLLFPIPLGACNAFRGELEDELSKLSYLLLILTMTQEDRRDRGFYIPFPESFGRKHFGSKWHKVRSASAEYSDVFDWNNRYLADSTRGFPKSVRLTAACRSGECSIYETKRKFLPVQHIDYGGLDAVSRKLVADFTSFSLPAIPPVFENPWQAIAWNRIAEGDFYASRCEYGRFHSNFTAFKHRHLLEYEGRRLVSIDIKASQMLCLGAVVRQIAGERPDLARWLALCGDGDVYAYFGSKTNQQRADAKYGLIRCVFDQNHRMIEMPEYRAMLSDFPTVANSLRDQKEKHGYRSIARLCQKMESQILIDNVIPQIPTVPVITVHDEYLVTAESVTIVLAAMRHSFAQYGLRPQFNVKEFNE